MRRLRIRIAVGLIAAVVGLVLADGAIGQDLPWVEGTTTVAVLPDTQYYAQKFPEQFEAQTKWIAENYQKRNIAYMVHLGDITQDDIPREWEVAKRCIDMLDGKVPYALAPGNHDYQRGSRKTLMNEYFPVAKFKPWPTFGGVFEEGKMENCYHLATIGEHDWIILILECGPRDAVLDWANKVMEQYPDRLGMMITHAYLFRNNVRYDHRKGSQRANPYGFAGEGNDGEQMWHKLVRRHPNMMMVICGHVFTGGPKGSYLASEGAYGNIVHEMMTDYQKLPLGGWGYMRLLEFLPDGKTVQVRTFSPSKKKTRKSEFEHFSFELQGPTREQPKPYDAASRDGSRLPAVAIAD